MDDRIAKYIESIPGFRYHPTDEELMLALKSMILGTYDLEHGVIYQFDVCGHEPWDLAALIDGRSKFKSNGKEWFCFNCQTAKYKNSKRCTRATNVGYWKKTGRKRNVINDDNVLMGFKQTLVFHQGRGTKGIRTGWVMHEYYLDARFLGDNSLGDSVPFVVCRLKYKKDKKGANASSSLQQEVHATNIHDIPTVTVESEVDESQISSLATPITPTSQEADNTSPCLDLLGEEWESLSDIPMPPWYQHTPFWENICGTSAEGDDY